MTKNKIERLYSNNDFIIKQNDEYDNSELTLDDKNDNESKFKYYCENVINKMSYNHIKNMEFIQDKYKTKIIINFK